MAACSWAVAVASLPHAAPGDAKSCLVSRRGCYRRSQHAQCTAHCAQATGHRSINQADQGRLKARHLPAWRRAKSPATHGRRQDAR